MPLRSWESQKLDVPLVCVCVCVCLFVPDFSDFSRVVYVRVTDGTEQYRFENRDLKVPERTVQKQAQMRITVGKRTGFEPLFGPRFENFLKMIV